VLAPAAPAQEPAPQPAAPAPAPASASPDAKAMVSVDEALGAYKTLETWVRACEVPADAPAPQGLERLGACCVTLRLDHHVIGRAYDFAGGPDSFVRVARAAITQAEPRLPVGHDATAEQQLKDAAARIAISLELAGTLIPTRFATFAEADAALEPGLDGIAARFGEKIAGVFPAAMLTMNRTPGESLAGAISDASGDVTLAIAGSPKNEAGAIAAERNATYYRFRVVHLAQPDAGLSPEFLIRGGRIVNPTDITTPTLHQFARALADNLVYRAKHAAGGQMLGTLAPAQGRYITASADPIEQSMAAAALCEYALLLKAAPAKPAADAPDSTDLCAMARQLLLKNLAPSTDDPVTAAAWLIADDAQLRLSNQPLDIDAKSSAKLGAAVASAFDTESGWLKEVPAKHRSLLALAMTIESQRPGLDQAEAELRHKRAESAVRTIYRDTDPKNLVSQMPWLGKAELLLAGDAKEIPATPALRNMRDLVWKYQLTPEDAGTTGQDLIGGIVFTTSRNPLPTWLTVRPIIFLAQMAADPRLTDDKEKFPELSHLLAAMRFLRQLMLDDASAYSAEDPAAAIGGIRSSLWDQRQPVDATALTLMAVCEALKTLTPKPAP
jgi:predicted secreted protein